MGSKQALRLWAEGYKVQGPQAIGRGVQGPGPSGYGRYKVQGPQAIGIGMQGTGVQGTRSKQAHRL